jgi:hypothetical protein
MKRINTELTITPKGSSKAWVVPFITSAEVTSGHAELTNTCIITLPKKIQFGTQNLRETLTVGSQVVVKGGYNDNLKELFVGCITQIELNMPMKLHCEDAMWLLKQKEIKTKTWANAKLGDVIQYLLQGSDIAHDCDNRTLGAYKTSKRTASQELAMLKEKYKLSIYLRKGRLWAGFAYPLDWAAKPNYTVAYIAQNDIVDSSLQQKKQNDIGIKIEGISIQKNGTTIKHTEGDGAGEAHTVHYPEMDLNALKVLVKEDLERMKKTGFSGSITVFGEPYIDHGYTVAFTNHDYPEQNGKYYADKVTTLIGIDGFRNTIELGKTAS